MFKIFIENFRLWWQKPANPRNRNLHREVSLLELFYDLVYVALLIQLTHFLAGHISFSTVFAYIAFFLMMFWAWFNGSLYYELHANFDIKSRVVIFIQMLCIIAMSIFMHGSLEEGYKGFALFYGIFLTIITILWWRTGVHDLEQKAVIKPIVIIFTFVSISFFISVFTPLTVSYYIWFISIAISLIYVVVFMVRPNNTKHAQLIEALKNISPSFVERFALIMTIILGEGISSIISGTSSNHHLHFIDGLNVVGSFLLLVCMWWIYFDFIARHLPKNSNLFKGLWIAFNFPVLASTGLVSVGILNLLEYSPNYALADKLLILVPLIIFLFCCLALMHVININEKVTKIYQISYINIIGAIVGLLICCWLDLSKTSTLWLAFICLLLPIYAVIVAWIKINKDDLDLQNPRHLS